MTVGMIVALVVAAAGAYLCSPLAGRAAHRLGVIDVPGGRKQHDAATPLLGGAAVVVAWTLGALVGGVMAPALFLGAGLACLVGTWDDWRTGGLRPAVKAALQVALAGIWLLASGHQGGAAVAGMACVVFAMNGFNLLDNTDGLCAVAALPPLAALACVGVFGDTGMQAALALALAGALAGFLPHNWPRARIFLGDGGSLVVGFLLGALVFDACAASAATPLAALVAGVALLLLPLLDTATVTFSRLRRGVAPWVGDRNHLSHRLHRLGLGEKSALAVLAAISALGALAATCVLLGLRL